MPTVDKAQIDVKKESLNSIFDSVVFLYWQIVVSLQLFVLRTDIENVLSVSLCTLPKLLGE